MNHYLERKSLPLRLAEMIEQELRANTWEDTLPGHRTLMQFFSVSAKTCLAAIDLLEARGIISAGEHGKRRRILVAAKKKNMEMVNLLFIDGYGYLSGEDQMQLQAYRSAWEAEGGKVHAIKFDFARFRNPGSLLSKAVASYSADAILLHVPPLAWVEAAVKLRPVFLAGGEWQGSNITGSAYNICDEVAKLANLLRGLGHERVVVPLDLVGRKMETAVREGLAQGLGVDGSDPALIEFCPVFPESVPAAWQQYWKKIFAKLRPTAVILTTDIQCLSLYGHCWHHGIRIPEDLSLICLETSEHLEWLDPVPTRMSFPVNRAATYFKKWFRNGCHPMGLKFFSLNYIEGGTCLRL